MDSTLLFLLAGLLIMLVAQPLATFLRLPVLSVYILWGILLGPSGLNLIYKTETLNYLYHFGLILLMFALGLKLKRPRFSRERRSPFYIFLFNGLATGIFVGLALTLFPFQPHQSLGLILFVGAIFTSSSLEVVAPFLHEFSYRSSHRVRVFISSLIEGTLISEIACLFLFSLLIFYFTKLNLAFFGILSLCIILYLWFLLVGFPIFARKAISHPKARKISVEDQSRALIVIILFTVWLAGILKIHAIVAAFLAGIALANLRLDRRVIQNFNFLSYGIFVPIFFLLIGVETDFRLLGSQENWNLFLLLAGVVLGTKIISAGIIAGKEKFTVREALGFGFASTPHLSSTLAAAIAGYEIKLITPAILNAIILVSILTTVLGPVVGQALLFPGARRQRDYRDIEDYLNLDFYPLDIHDSLFSIMTHIRGLEIFIYPVVDKKGLYQGVLHLSELRDLLFAEELNHLVIAADLLYKDTPVLYRDEPLEKAIAIFKEGNYYAIPVLEATEAGDSYVGLVLLKDILPENLPLRAGITCQ